MTSKRTCDTIEPSKEKQVQEDKEMNKTAKFYVREMIKSLLKDKELLGEKVTNSIKKALDINCNFTSTYGLQVEKVEDIKGKNSKDSGFYIILSGTRCGVRFFLNNDMEIVRKPNKNKVEVKYSYDFYNDNEFSEQFWIENF